jgi:ParB-like chromosome segregation protein Spo0J
MSRDEFTNITTNPGLVAGDNAMRMTLPKPASAADSPHTIRPTLVDDIEVGERLRSVDPKKVEALYDDICHHGLLHPIGLRRDKDSPTKYWVIYGAHRLKAFQKGWVLAQRMLKERGDKDPEAYRMARAFQTIPAVVYSAEISKAASELKEVAENLIRSDLTKPQLSLHRTRYTYLLQKLAESNKRRLGGNKAKGHDVPLPQLAEQAAKELGVTVRTIRRDHEAVQANANAAAREYGVEPIKNLKPTSPPEVKERALGLAAEAERERKAAADQGKDVRKAMPVTKAEPNVITVRLVVDDPLQIADRLWRVNEADKPITRETLGEVIRLIKARLEG